MNTSAALLVFLAVAVPSGLSDGHGDLAQEEIAHAAPERERSATGLQAPQDSLFSSLENARRIPIQQQVRIERRIILRISPPSRGVRERMNAELPQPAEEQEFKVGDKERCVRMNDIMGVQPHRGNRLLLYMRRSEMMSAKLERSCGAEDFYSGFYVERSEDGRLCVRRERLQSRAGAQCEVSEMNHVVIKDD